MSGLFEDETPSLREIWWRRKWLKKIDAEFGPLERRMATDLDYPAFGYYVSYLSAGIEPTEARRLGRKSAFLGDDATNYE